MFHFRWTWELDRTGGIWTSQQHQEVGSFRKSLLGAFDPGGVNSQRTPPTASSPLESFKVGTWLSLVEHSLGVRGVGSSNLPVPTNLQLSFFPVHLQSSFASRTRRQELCGETEKPLKRCFSQEASEKLWCMRRPSRNWLVFLLFCLLLRCHVKVPP